MELDRARAVHALGAPCPLPFERVEHEGRTGIVYERIDGPLLLDSLRDGSASSAQVADRLAGLHARLHAVRIPPESTLPRLRDWIRRWLARLTDDVRERGERELERLPDEEGLCHGDLHPGNVIVSGARLVVVDWVNASAGPLALDVARSYVLLAWQGAKRRDGAYQAARLELAERYREAMTARVRAGRLRARAGLRRGRAAPRRAREPLRRRASIRDSVEIDFVPESLRESRRERDRRDHIGEGRGHDQGRAPALPRHSVRGAAAGRAALYARRSLRRPGRACAPRRPTHLRVRSRPASCPAWRSVPRARTACT